MFLENDYARPLFDFEKGGKPSAFQCLADGCNKVTRTERGMRMHLKTVHNWEEQACLYSTERPSIPSQRAELDRRVAGLPSLNEEVRTHKVMVKTRQPSTKSPETNEGELLKLMREEN